MHCLELEHAAPSSREEGTQEPLKQTALPVVELHCESELHEGGVSGVPPMQRLVVWSHEPLQFESTLQCRPVVVRQPSASQACVEASVERTIIEVDDGAQVGHAGAVGAVAAHALRVDGVAIVRAAGAVLGAVMELAYQTRRKRPCATASALLEWRD